jgi:membrane associated rhomboid family serine protease
MTRWVTFLIATNVAVFFLQQLQPGLTIALGLIPAYAAVRPWTIVTYMFLHGSFGHLFWNMLALYFFGPRLEALLGGRRFLTLYFLSGIGGGVASFMPMYYSALIVGASGAIMGVLAAYAVVWPHDKLYVYFAIPVPAWLFTVLFAGYSVLGGAGRVDPGTAHYAHLGGLLVGGGYMLLVRRNSSSRKFRERAVPVIPIASDADALRRWASIPVAQLHELNRGEVQRLLEKVRTSGARSLTLDERATLDRFSRA